MRVSLLLFSFAITTASAWVQQNAFVVGSCMNHVSVNHLAGKKPSSTALSPRKSTRLFEKESLTFSCQFDVCSDPLPTKSLDEACEFVRSKMCRNHFLSAGGKSYVNEVEWSEKLEQLWVESCEKHYGDCCLPNQGGGDCVLAGQTNMQFPSMRLENTVFSGVKSLNDDKGYPFYQAIAIAEKGNPVGPAPVVWIYRKLTGTSKNDDMSSSRGKAKSKISLEDIEDGGYRLHFVCNLKIIVEFPKVLVKILPASKERMEEQGSSAIRKAVEKDIMNAVTTTLNAFEEWKAATVAT